MRTFRAKGLTGLWSSLIFGLCASAAVAQETATPPPPPPPPPAEWRTIAPEDLLVIDTNKGRILVELAPQIAPAHVERIRLLAARGFYDTLKWHRVIDWFMAQTGDPLGTGDGQSFYPDLKAEFTFRRGADMAFTPVAAPAGALVGFVGSVPVQTQPDALMAGTGDHKVHGWGLYCPGVAGMARDEGNDTANSQFFLMRQAYPSLEKRYTGWGRVISGLDVVRAIKVGEPVAAPQDKMDKVRVLSDIPAAERPKVRVIDPKSAWFRAEIESARARMGADFSACAIRIPSEVK